VFLILRSNAVIRTGRRLYSISKSDEISVQQLYQVFLRILFLYCQVPVYSSKTFPASADNSRLLDKPVRPASLKCNNPFGRSVVLRLRDKLFFFRVHVMWVMSLGMLVAIQTQVENG